MRYQESIWKTKKYLLLPPHHRLAETFERVAEGFVIDTVCGFADLREDGGIGLGGLRHRRRGFVNGIEGDARDSVITKIGIDPLPDQIRFKAEFHRKALGQAYAERPVARFAVFG